VSINSEMAVDVYGQLSSYYVLFIISEIEWYYFIWVSIILFWIDGWWSVLYS